MSRRVTRPGNNAALVKSEIALIRPRVDDQATASGLPRDSMPTCYRIAYLLDPDISAWLFQNGQSQRLEVKLPP